jgi:hypothetical protein
LGDRGIGASGDGANRECLKAVLRAETIDPGRPHCRNSDLRSAVSRRGRGSTSKITGGKHGKESQDHQEGDCKDDQSEQDAENCCPAPQGQREADREKAHHAHDGGQSESISRQDQRPQDYRGQDRRPQNQRRQDQHPQNNAGRHQDCEVSSSTKRRTKEAGRRGQSSGP